MDINNIRYLFGGVFKIALVVILVSALGLGIFSFFNRDNDVYGKLPVPYFQNLVFGKANWLTENTEVESVGQAAVYKVKSRSLSRAQAWTLAGKFGLPQGGEIIIEKDNTESYHTRASSKELVVGLTSGEVHYKNSGVVQATKAGPQIDKAKAVETAKATAKSLGIDTSTYNLEKPLFDFLDTSDASHLIPTSQDKATVVYVVFLREFGGVKVATVGGQDSLSLGLNNQYELFALDYANLTIEDNQASYKVLSPGAARSRIAQGKGSLDHYKATENTIQDPTSLTVGKGELQFYNDKKSDYVQPIFIFSAVVSNSRDKLDGVVYLPALKDIYFKK